MIELWVDECTCTVLASITYSHHCVIENVPIPRDLVEGIMRLPIEERFRPLSYWVDQYTRVF